MAKAFLMCGKICSGKTAYAMKLRKMHDAVVLSVDDITLALFGQDAGEMHSVYVERLENYLYEKSLEIIETGTNVVLDWGFWTKRERDFAREFYGSRGIELSFCYISISPEEWSRRIVKRNQSVVEGKNRAYYVDSGLAKKFEAIFEEPDENELSEMTVIA